jgi:hypothetical protein
MRYLKILGTAMVVMVLWGLGSLKATAMEGPPGTYRETCRNIRMRGDDLRAVCKSERGGWRDAYLDGADRCWGDIANDNGRLICNKTASLPRGSYLETCRDIWRHYDGLRAVCRNIRGRWVTTYLERFDECHGRIVNDDGRLRCGGDRDDWDRGRPREIEPDRRGDGPRGSYTESCRDIRIRGDQIFARCEDLRGGWRETTLNDYHRCVGDIVNDDGYLQCTRPGGRIVPRGSYVETCRDIYVRGDTLRARCKDRDGRWVWTQLNDWDDCRSGIFNVDGRLECRR